MLHNKKKLLLIILSLLLVIILFILAIIFYKPSLKITSLDANPHYTIANHRNTFFTSYIERRNLLPSTLLSRGQLIVRFSEFVPEKPFYQIKESKTSKDYLISAAISRQKNTAIIDMYLGKNAKKTFTQKSLEVVVTNTILRLLVESNPNKVKIPSKELETVVTNMQQETKIMPFSIEFK